MHSAEPNRYEAAPLLVFWETTKACPLACVHCRAVAQPNPGPGELTTEEGRRLIEELAGAGRPRPVLVLTGGDCASRGDLVDLAAHARHLGVPVAVAPSVSARLSDPLLRALRHEGVRHVSISLDGAGAATHDGIRQVTGHFAATLEAVGRLREAGFEVQVNTAVMSRNVGELADIASLLVSLGVSVWEVFFLVTVGRGSGLEELTAAEAEQVCWFLVEAARYKMVVRTVEAPFFRRVKLERATGAEPPAGGLLPMLTGRLAELLGEPTSPVLAPSVATRDGKGIIFVGHTGDVLPSGFLPLSLGNVRDRPLLDIYRSHPLLRAIRAGEFTGECGRCEHRDLCGGSRARAFASTGDPLGDDPGCLRVRNPKGPSPDHLVAWPA